MSLTTITFLPFLYQTRTLAGISWSVGKSKGPRLRFRPFASASQLYYRSRTQQRTKKAGRVRSKDSSIPFEHETRTPAPPPPTKEQAALSTLTSGERDTFERIFSDIERRELRPLAQPGNENDTGNRNPVEEGEGRNDLVTALRAILDHANESFGGQSDTRVDFDPLSPMRELQSPTTDRGKLVMKYPESLRMAAHHALGFLDKETPKVSRGNSSIVTDMERNAAIERSIQVGLIQREMYSKVEKRMKAAKSDVELWKIMEEEVFSMIDNMKLGDQHLPKAGTEGVASAEIPSIRKSKRKDGSADVEEASNNSKKPSLSVRVHGPLYPAYLLAGMRLLNTQFARSSPLTLAVLPRIKELGLASYVLGVSTPFYNELMKIQWERYGDVSAVFNLLDETRVAGLSTDEDTRKLLRDIQKYLETLAKKSYLPAERSNIGTFVRHMTLLPQYNTKVRDRIRKWLGQVQRSIEEREQTLDF